MSAALTQALTRVLLVDDDEEDYLITRDLFAEIPGAAYDLCWVDTFEAGLQAVLEHPPEICLIDYRLGLHNGLELVEEARRQGSRVPMILLTGLQDREVDMRAMHAGVADFLVKGQLRSEGLERSLRYALERKRAEEQLLSLEAQLRQAQKMEAIGQLAAGVAHDFNNLLTVIQGHTGLLQARLPPELDAGKSLAKIALAADRASHLVRQLLTLSRKQILQPTSLDLNDVISRISNMLHRILGEDIVLRALPAADLPVVHADGGMIEQVLMNLAVNARDAMPKGGQLTISTNTTTISEAHFRQHPHAQIGPAVCLAVSDTGCGMSPDVLSWIFDPFFTTKEPGKGTGLGLTTVYSIVQQHRGWIEVKSEVGRGTTFLIFLPVAANRRPSTASVPAAPVAPTHGHETVLLVEDETVVRELALEILKRHGYHVLTAGSGVEALEVWAQHRKSIDLLLTDLVMPGGINGRELAQRLRHDAADLRVIYTSGYSPGIAGKDLTGMVDFNFLPKPYQPSKLAAAVRECLDSADGRIAARDEVSELPI